MAFAIGSVVRRCYIYKDVWSAEIARFRVTMLSRVWQSRRAVCHYTRTLSGGSRWVSVVSTETPF